MVRLTRQVRFAINSAPDAQLENPPTNSFGGYPSLTGLGHYFALDVALAGEIDPETNYLINIKAIDNAVRREIVPLVMQSIAAGQFTGGGLLMREMFRALQPILRPVAVESLVLHLSPTLSLGFYERELPMVRVSQRFEFSASHRLHNPALNDAQNREAFGKCNNPHGHGHNYELQVTVAGEPDANGVVYPILKLEQIVADTVVRRFDHKHLNLELPEFREVNPTVENIARVIHGLLKQALEGTVLHSVVVWETPKTWCEYLS